MSSVFSNKRQRNGGFYLWISLVIIILDQVTKYLCVNYIEYGTRGIEITPFFNLVHVYNLGAAFSMFADWGGVQRYLLAGIAVVMTLIFIVVLLRTKASMKLHCLSYVLFIGGAVGNLIDRIAYGHVIDFLLFYWQDNNGHIVWSYPAFNVADIAVCCGAALLVYLALFSKEK